jgi:hypothetical protein
VIQERSTVTKAADHDDEDLPPGTARLFDMDTREVSLVDHPANKKPLLIVKRDDGSQETIEVEQTAKAETKAEGGKSFPASAYAYAPDSSSPSTWKLRLYDEPGDSKPSVKLTAYAAAALGPKGFRGHQVQIPDADRAKVRAKVLAAWHRARAGADAGDAEVPASLKKSIAEAVAELEGVAHLADQFEVGAPLSAALGQVEKALAEGKPAESQETNKMSQPTTTVVDPLAAAAGLPAGGSVPASAPTLSAGGDANVAKVGRPMNGDRLERLKGHHRTLKAAIGELKTGTVPLEKFDSVAQGLSAIIGECDVAKFVEKAAKTRKMVGASDLRGLSPLNPNVGAGVQPDVSTVADARAVFGEGVPAGPVDVAEVMKRLAAIEKQNQDLAVAVQKKDKAITGLQNEVVSLKKFRDAPSAFDEAEAAELLDGGDETDLSADVEWEADMASPIDA